MLFNKTFKCVTKKSFPENGDGKVHIFSNRFTCVEISELREEARQREEAIIEGISAGVQVGLARKYDPNTSLGILPHTHITFSLICCWNMSLKV